jgi:hypothetical protein
MNETPAREIVAISHRPSLFFAFGSEIIADLRPVEAGFFAAVNATQQEVIAKRLAEERLTSLSDLPLAAKQFALSFLELNHGEQIRGRVKALDVAASRISLGLHGLHPARKRRSSGVFVILPRSCQVLLVGRMSLISVPDTFDYWNEIEEEAARLGAIELQAEDFL